MGNNWQCVHICIISTFYTMCTSVVCKHFSVSTSVVCAHLPIHALTDIHILTGHCGAFIVSSVKHEQPTQRTLNSSIEWRIPGPSCVSNKNTQHYEAYTGWYYEGYNGYYYEGYNGCYYEGCTEGYTGYYLLWRLHKYYFNAVILMPIWTHFAQN